MESVGHRGAYAWAWRKMGGREKRGKTKVRRL